MLLGAGLHTPLETEMKGYGTPRVHHNHCPCDLCEGRGYKKVARRMKKRERQKARKGLDPFIEAGVRFIMDTRFGGP